MNKYIDAERLKAEIKRLYYNEAEKDESILAADAYKNALDNIESFIDSSPDENNPEPYNPVYNEDYLNEKIAKATKSWEGVDVDKMLAECRGYDEEPNKSMEEAAEEYGDKEFPDEPAIGRWGTGDYEPPVDNEYPREIAKEAFIAGVKWQKNKDKETIEVAEDHAFMAGSVWQKEQMLKDAVEGYVNYYEDSGGKLMAEAQVGCPYHIGNTVKIIIVKEK